MKGHGGHGGIGPKGGHVIHGTGELGAHGPHGLEEAKPIGGTRGMVQQGSHFIGAHGLQEDGGQHDDGTQKMAGHGGSDGGQQPQLKG